MTCHQAFCAILAKGLTELYENKPVLQLKEKLLQTLSGENFPLEERMFAQAVRISKKAIDWNDRQQIIFYGQTNVLSWSELSSKQELNGVCQEIEERSHLYQEIDDAYGLNRAYFKIGNEIQLDSLNSCALVMANYGSDNHSIGSIWRYRP